MESLVQLIYWDDAVSSHFFPKYHMNALLFEKSQDLSVIAQNIGPCLCRVDKQQIW